MADSTSDPGSPPDRRKFAWGRFRYRWKSAWRSLLQGDRGPRSSEVWKGDYPTWQAAEAASEGYDSAHIVQKCRAAVLRVKSGEAAYERDSVLFEEVQYSWGLLAGLQFAAARHAGRLSVLDFGGSLGSTYFQNRAFLRRLPACSWNIVEQPDFVDVGRAEFQDEQLRFHRSVAECLLTTKPDVVVVSGSLQYMPNPHALLAEIIGHGFDVVILDRTPFISGRRDVLTVQTVPAEIYQASYPSWFFSRDKVEALFAADYDLLARTPWWCDPPAHINHEHLAMWDGLIFIRKPAKA